MLDVYRSYYGLSGEPFRLGPDYRFSLHHTSYANAKAYLDYAIYQGEGFIAITGGPGTGKTTLISEILATLDRSRVQVATLTSTQLESRDLLHMVASAFGIQPDRFDKANLLLDIEKSLVKKLRDGQRAMLIVDEAQGLSTAALEELRLLANLQYQYQLLLQICLVGQEKLLELIHSPGMEHLQQRLVAATVLDPLSFDETIDYIEHRLTKVGWQGDPAIDEAALRLVYRYSGGTPRRINLIANRLFLLGGMEHKHRLTGEDGQAVVEGLIQEHLLGSQAVIADDAIPEAQSADEEPPRPRHLPRPGRKPEPEPEAEAEPKREPDLGLQAVPEATPESGQTTSVEAAAKSTAKASAATGQPKWDTGNLPGSRPQPAAGAAGAAAAAVDPLAFDDEETTRVRGREPASLGGTPKPTLEELLWPQNPVAPAPKKKSGAKGIALIAILLVGAGIAFFLNPGREASGPQSERTITHLSEDDTAPPPATDAGAAAGSVEDLTPSESASGSAETPDGQIAATGADDTNGESGAILRQSAPGTGDSGTAPEAGAAATDFAASGSTDETLAETTAAAEAATRASESVDTAESGAATGQPLGYRVGSAPTDEAGTVTSSVTESATRTADTETTLASAPAVSEPADRAGAAASAAVADKTEPEAASPSPVAETLQAPKVPVAVQNGAVPSAPGGITAQRDKLRQDAEARFSSQLAQVKPAESASAPVTAVEPRVKPVEPAAKPASHPQPPATAAAPTVIAASQPKTAPVETKKKPLTTPEDVKNTLLKGRWSSSNKPATLLPSSGTYCETRSGGISCVSVPQNVKTQYGLALYKVETQLSGFSAEGLFEMSYRTLVKLVDQPEKNPKSAGGWQITEYAMSCKLIGDDRVTCLDGKGITREYRRVKL